MKRPALIVTLIFIILAGCLEGLLAYYWIGVLHPRLRAEAESQARVLAQSQEASLLRALRTPGLDDRREAAIDAMDNILLMESSASGAPFIESIRLELDYGVVDAPDGTLDLQRGERRAADAFTVDVGLYDPETFELLGIAWIDVSPEYFRLLSTDVRRQVLAQGAAILGLLLVVWLVLIVLLAKFERQRAERERAEHALREHERKFRRLLDDIGTYFVYSRGPDGKLETVSDSVRSVLGLSPAELISTLHEILTDHPINARALARFNASPEACGPGSAEIEVRDREGGFHRIELTEVLQLDEIGAVCGIDGIARDVTEQRSFELELQGAREEAEAASRAKSQFLANVSHEIRTPMNAVLGMATLALRTELDPRQRKYIEKIQSSGQLLLRLINDILDLSRIEAGKLTVQQVDFGLDDVLSDLSDVVGEKARDKGLEVLFSVDPAVPRTLVGDPLRLEQVLVNLVNNAVKFTDDGEIVVDVKLEEQTESRAVLRFDVRDTGIGIDPASIERLFEPFTQVDESSTRQHGGAGLGLAISRRLVELMEGRIGGDSTPGRGTTFSFTAAFGLGQKPQRRSLRREDLDGLPVLVVDDNPTARQVFEGMLRSLGFAVKTAPLAELAIEELRRADDLGTPIPLVLMDWKMPGLNGIEATRRIKQGGALSAVPAIVLVTAYGGEELMRQAEEVGADVFVQKPVSQSGLWDAVIEALGTQRGTVRRATIRPRTSSVRFAPESRVLLVEDNELNREVARELLAGLGVTVEEASSGEEAIEKIRTSSPALVLMDVQMPGMDGVEATRVIRNDLGLEELPVVALTAHAMIGDRQRFLDAGMSDYVAKPIEESALVRVLSEYLSVESEVPLEVTETLQEKREQEMRSIDLTEALQRLNGNHKLLHRLLGDFIRSYSSAAEDIDMFVNDGRAKEAADLAHTIRGAAATLSIKRVASAAGDAEQSIRDSRPADGAIAALRSALRELEVEGVTFGSREKMDDTPATVIGNAGEVSAAYEELYDHLVANSLHAREAFDRLRLLATENQPRIVELGDQIDALDYDRALKSLNSVRRDLGLEEK